MAANPDQIGSISAYRDVWRTPAVPMLLASSIFARLPLGMSSLAILLRVREGTGSFAIAGAAVAAFVFSGAALAPVQGRLVGRFGPPLILLPGAAIQATLLGALILASMPGTESVLVIAVAAAAGACLPPVSACLRALCRS